MTLGSESAAVLMRALNILNHQMSPAQHALLTPDERKSAMHQLTVAVEAAAKLADVAHVEALTAHCATSGPASDDSGALTKSIVVTETEKLRTEVAAGSEVEDVGKVFGSCGVLGVEVPAVALTVVEQVEEGTNQVRRAQQHMEEIDTENGVRGGEPMGDIEGAKEDMWKLMVEKEMMEVENERLEGDEQSTGKSLEVSVQEKERLQMELERVRIEKAKTETVRTWLRVELERLNAEMEDLKRGFHSSEMAELAELEMSSAARMIEKSHEETENLEEEEERVGVDLQRSLQETERLKVILDRVRNQKAIIEASMERLRKEVDQLRYLTEIQREGGLIIRGAVVVFSCEDH